jgi:hypothetical protein
MTASLLCVLYYEFHCPVSFPRFFYGGKMAAKEEEGKGRKEKSIGCVPKYKPLPPHQNQTIRPPLFVTSPLPRFTPARYPELSSKNSSSICSVNSYLKYAKHWTWRSRDSSVSTMIGPCGLHGPRTGVQFPAEARKLSQLRGVFRGHTVATSCKPEGRGFETWWGEWIFFQFT